MEGRTNPRAAPKMAPETQQLFDAIEDDKLADIEKLLPDADLTGKFSNNWSLIDLNLSPIDTLSGP